MTFQPSPRQSAFFSELSSGTSSILLLACAGSGKTTTIVHSTSLIPRHLLTVFLAFNKRIATELESRVPSHVQVGTFHARGLKALSNSLPTRPKIDGNKVRDLLKKNLSWKDQEAYSQFVCKLVSLAKSAGIGTDPLPNEPEAWQSLISHFALSIDSPDADISRAIVIAQVCLSASNDQLSVLDFDDMLYLALLRKARFDKANFLFIDEAQDTNGVQRSLLPLMMAEDCRLIAVGDPNQSIYGFRGADAQAMEELRVKFNMKSMPLDISYRCSKAVVREAQKYCI